MTEQLNFQPNDLSKNLNLLQQLSVVIARQQNEHVDSFNSAIDEIEALRNEVAELKRTVAEKQKTNEAIHADRLAILEKHNNSVTTANATIRALQTKQESLRVELEELQRADPKRMERLYKAQKEQNESLKSANEKLLSENDLLKKRNNKLRADLENSTNALWTFGHESVYPFFGSVNGIVDDERKPVEAAVWWAHESGIRLLCSYNHDDDRILLCDPVDEETGRVFLPTLVADKAMKKYFKELRKEREKLSKKTKKAA